MAVDRKNLPRIILDGCQFKNIEKLRLLAKTLETLEVEFGIHECRIELVDCFICPWISREELDTMNKTSFEKVVRTLIFDHRASQELNKKKKRK